MNKRRPILYSLLLVTALIVLFMLWKSRGSFTGGSDAFTDATVDLHSDKAQQAAKAVQANVNAAQIFKLSNGLQVVIIPDREATYISNMVWYKTGAVDDPPGKTGLAHFVEHLTFAETDDRREIEFSRLLERLGKRQDALTTYDYTVYYQLVTKQELESVLALEAHRMTGRKMDAVPLAREQQEVLEERRELDANPETQLDERVRSALYGQHPYGAPVLGWPREFDSLDASDAAKFYRQRYAPNNAIIVLQGPLDVAVAKAFVDRYFGAIPQAAVPLRRIPATIPVPNGNVLVQGPTQHPTWRLDLLAPSYTAGATAIAPALQLLTEMIGGCADSRLQRRLVRQSRTAASVEVVYDPESLDLSTVSIVVRLRPGSRVQDVAASVRAELDAIASGEVSEADLTHAKRDLAAKTAVPVDKMPAAARMVGEALTHARTLQEVQNWWRTLEGVGVGEVREAAKVLISAPSVTGLLAERSSDAAGSVQSGR